MRVLAILALCSLAAAQQERQARALVGQLRSQHDEVRATAEAQLVRLGSAGVPILIAVLRSDASTKELDDAFRATRIAHVLARLGSEAADALPTLERSIDIVNAAISAPWPHRTENGLTTWTVTAIPESWRTLHGELRRARVAVATLPDTPISTLIDDLSAKDPFAREHAAMVLGRHGADATIAIPALLSGLRERAPDVNLRPVCARALVRIAPDAPVVGPAYIALLEDDDPALRREAVMALGRLGGRVPANVYFLQPCLADKDPLVVRETITALGMLGRSAATAVPELERLCDSPDRQIAARAAAALRQIRGH